MNSDLHIVEIGQGEPIVFIHGSFDPAQETFSEQENLADEYRVVLVDRRGCGESPSAGSLDFDAQVDDILRVLGDGSSGGALIRSPAQQRFRIHWLAPRELLHGPYAARRFDGSSVPHQVQLRPLSRGRLTDRRRDLRPGRWQISQLPSVADSFVAVLEVTNRRIISPTPHLPGLYRVRCDPSSDGRCADARVGTMILLVTLRRRC